MCKLRSLLLFTVSIIIAVILPCASLAAITPKQGVIPLNQIEGMVVFGDSLSDTGNLYNALKISHSANPQIPIVPASPPYFSSPFGSNGRCSSGYLWIDWLAKQMNFATSMYKNNYAYAGTKIQNVYPPDSNKELPYDLKSFVASYLVTLGFFPPATNNNLFVIWDGSNDYLSSVPNSDPDVLTTNVITALQTQMQLLITQAHAKYFLVVNLVDLGLTPLAKNNPDTNYSALLTNLSQLHNQKLTAMLTQLRNSNQGVIIMQYDAFSDFRDIVNNPQKYNLDDSTHPCYNGSVFNTSAAKKSQKASENNDQAINALKKQHIDVVNNMVFKAIYTNPEKTIDDLEICNNPSMHLFWDSVHPTAIVHKIIADKAYAALQ